jgi:hypothetical protein
MNQRSITIQEYTEAYNGVLLQTGIKNFKKCKGGHVHADT